MKRTKKGFTLVELLVVIAIIAIIAAVAIPVTIGQINKSKIKTAQNEVSSAFDAIELGVASEGVDGLQDYLNDNFNNPTYVREITVGATELEVTEVAGVDIGDLDANLLTYAIPTDFQSLITGITTITWDGDGAVSIT